MKRGGRGFRRLCSFRHFCVTLGGSSIGRDLDEDCFAMVDSDCDEAKKKRDDRLHGTAKDDLNTGKELGIQKLLVTLRLDIAKQMQDSKLSLMLGEWIVDSASALQFPCQHWISECHRTGKRAALIPPSR